MITDMGLKINRHKGVVSGEQRQVNFTDDESTTGKADDGPAYTSLRHLCQALGPNAPAQARCIIRQPILKSGCQGVAKMAIPGGKQRSGVLCVDLVLPWLSGVDGGAGAAGQAPLCRRQCGGALVNNGAGGSGRYQLARKADTFG
jgi:hypothetical protein